jgi:hypothetical protein
MARIATHLMSERLFRCKAVVFDFCVAVDAFLLRGTP